MNNKGNEQIDQMRINIKKCGLTMEKAAENAAENAKRTFGILKNSKKEG
jgi:hypothetical protein